MRKVSGNLNENRWTVGQGSRCVNEIRPSRSHRLILSFFNIWQLRPEHVREILGHLVDVEVTQVEILDSSFWPQLVSEGCF